MTRLHPSARSSFTTSSSSPASTLSSRNSVLPSKSYRARAGRWDSELSSSGSSSESEPDDSRCSVHAVEALIPASKSEWGRLWAAVDAIILDVLGDLGSVAMRPILYTRARMVSASGLDWQRTGGQREIEMQGRLALFRSKERGGSEMIAEASKLPKRDRGSSQVYTLYIQIDMYNIYFLSTCSRGTRDCPSRSSPGGTHGSGAPCQSHAAP